MKITLLGTLTSKDISKDIDLDVTLSVKQQGKFTVVEFEGEDEDFFRNYLIDKYTQGYTINEISQDKYSGKLVDVGKIGYGIYCDINCDKDVLISLASLRETFGGHFSTRQYIYNYGLIEDLCIDIIVTNIERGTDKIWAKIDPSWKERYLSSKGTILASRTSESEIRGALKKSSFLKVVTIDPICSSSVAIHCNKNIDPPGIVSLLGKRLPNARFGIVGDV